MKPEVTSLSVCRSPTDRPRAEFVDVIIVIESFDLGGMERQFNSLAKEIVRRGYKVLIVERLGDKTYEAIPGLNVIGLTSRKRRGWRYIYFLSRVISKYRPKIVYGGSSALLLLKLFHHEVAVYIAARSVGGTDGHYGWKVRLESALALRLISLSSGVITNSNAAAMRIQQQIGEKMISIIPNAIDFRRFEFSYEKRNHFRKHFGLDESRAVFLFVGRLDDVKNPRLFMKAARAMVRAGIPASFIVVGKGNSEYAASLITEYKEEIASAAIRLWESYSDMQELYSGVDVLVSTSRTEGASNVIAEAMVSGLKVIATPVGDNEVILRGTGIILATQQSEELVRVMSCLIKEVPDPSRKYRSKVLPPFISAAEMCEAHLKVFKIN
jgi:glycosyltransferase involved in cell wall biosynthesis